MALRDVEKAVFWDGELEPGDLWFDQIKQHIDAAPQLFVFWCDHSACSQQVRREFTYAITQKKRVVPVLLDDTALVPELAPIHGIDLRGAIHHYSSSRAPWSTRVSVRSRVVPGVIAILAAFLTALGILFSTLFQGVPTFPSAEAQAPSASPWVFTAIATTLAFLVLYGLRKYRSRSSTRVDFPPAADMPVSRRPRRADLHIEESEVQIPSDSIEKIVSQFSQHIEGSSIRNPPRTMTFPFDREPSNLWTLHRDGKVASCEVRFVPIGVDVRVLRNGKLRYARTFTIGEEAMAWAEEERERMLEDGWSED
jgi:hypothetical protein